MRMSWNSTKSGFGWLPMGFHWLMLLLLAAAYAAMEFKSIYPKGSAGREAMAYWHYTLGLCAFLLVWLRLLVRVSGAEPEIEPAPPAWQAIPARAMHWALYTLMIVLPLIGWLTLGARGTAVTFFGAELPALIGKNREFGRFLKEIHEFLATAGYFLIGSHAAAALYHHYVRRDNTLKLMLPGR